MDSGLNAHPGLAAENLLRALLCLSGKSHQGVWPREHPPRRIWLGQSNRRYKRGLPAPTKTS